MKDTFCSFQVKAEVRVLTGGVSFKAVLHYIGSMRNFVYNKSNFFESQKVIRREKM
jgi:hypothetical protein